MPIWDDLITENDRAMYAKYRAHESVGFGQRPAVLVVDFTHAFVDDRFSTGYSATGVPAVKATAQLLQAARAKGVPVMYTKGYPWKTGAELGLWKSAGARTASGATDLPHPNEVVPELAPAPADPEIPKSKPSAFFGTYLVSILNTHQVDTVLVCGMTTSGCVRATVVDGFSYGYKMVVPIECVADRSETGHKANLFDIQMKYGDVIDLAKAIDYINGLPAKP